MTCDIKLVTCGSSSWCESCGAEWDTGDEPIPCKAGTAVGGAYARGREAGRAEERSKNVALLRSIAARAREFVDSQLAAGRSEESMLGQSAGVEAFETAAFAIESAEDGA